MKRANLLLIVFLFGMGSLAAQSFVGKLNQNPIYNSKKFEANDTLKILAVLSDFQKDNDDATYGNGKFESIYTKDYGKSILDPIPHDKAYFENHLKFVQNYFAKVSNGKLNITYTVLDNILTVSKTMRNYTPPLDDLNNHAPLGKYLDEVWKLADAQYPTVNFSDYDLFFVLHAGAGKDISLPGSLANERDLPSVYLNEKSLKNIGYDGFPVNGGSFKITNSAILPETESREMKGFNGKTLIELTTNGLFVATVGSYLGLPDLYNTKTGRSAIGRFGLMDGQSMFTYKGIFPPEPSAWEKMRLGWITPTEISIGNHSLNIVNEFVASGTDTALIKIPINATEYYLIENRKRDALKDGSTVSYISNGVLKKKTFDRDYKNYIYYNVDTLEGVIVDVDEFDWALPAVDRNYKIENFSEVGLIIWHIDERIIKDNYETNTINNDRYKRGVAVVEADGIRDIGEEFKTIFGELIIGEGTKEDTWYKSNPSDYYKRYGNKFSADTKPKALANSGANSLITLSNFSDISNRTSFDISFGSDNIDLISNFDLGKHFKTKWLSSVNNGNEVVHYAFSDVQTIKFNSDGIKFNSGPNREVARIIDFKPLLIGSGGKEFVIKTHNSKLSVYIIEGATSNLLSTSLPNTDSYSTSPVLLLQNNNIIEFLVGTDKGIVVKYSLDISSQIISHIESNQIFTTPVKQIAILGNGYSAISNEYYWSSKFAIDNSPISLSEKIIQLVNTQEGAEKVSIIQTKNSLIHISKSIEISEIKETDSVYTFSLTNLKSDGNNYIIQNSGNHLQAINFAGSEATNFPFQDEFNETFTSSPLSVDLNDDGAGDIITFTENGKILAIDGITGKMIDGFPISSGGKVSTVPIVFTENGKTALGVITENNQFMSWNISKYDGKKIWTEENGNASNTSSVVAASSSEAIAEFFPQNKAYNWPNPVYDGVTNIRYFVAEDSKAEVTIFDLAGDLVAKLTGNAIGGFDNEIVWNVNNIQSGVYFAHLEVTSNSGKTESKIIKIAVIK